MKYIYILSVIILFFSACVKDRTVSRIGEGTVQTFGDTTPTKGIIVFNEYLNWGHGVENGQYDSSEYYYLPPAGTVNSHWLELYNQSNYNINISNGNWYLTDDFTIPNLFQIPKSSVFHPQGWSIAPHGWLRIWCDTIGRARKDIHTNFGTSHSGPGKFGLYYKNTGNQYVVIDTLTYPANTTEKDQSFGRIPDGIGSWTMCSTPTPNASNK